jgi:hypothetical protein
LEIGGKRGAVPAGLLDFRENGYTIAEGQLPEI